MSAATAETVTTDVEGDLLSAIEAFVERHADDDAYKDAISRLTDTADELRDRAGESNPDESPGRRAARRAAGDDDEAKGEPRPERKDRREPRSFGEARERATDRLRSSPKDGGKDPDEARGQQATADEGGDAA